MKYYEKNYLNQVNMIYFATINEILWEELFESSKYVTCNYNNGLASTNIGERNV